MSFLRVVVVSVEIASLVLLGGCASSTGVVDRSKPRTVVGRDGEIRISAQLEDNPIAPGAAVPITYEVENLRSEAIAIAELLPETQFDAEAGRVTVNFGAEVPGNALLPRLVVIQPGARMSFSAVARLNIPIAMTGGNRPYPRYLRLKLHFLRDIEPFQMLIGIPERAIADAALADRLFARWVESTESVTTSDVPIRWQAGRGAADASRRRPSTRPPAPRTLPSPE